MNSSSLYNPSESRQSHSLAMDLVPTLLGVVASGKLTPFIMPAIIKVVILPLLDVINTISKAFIFIGLLAYFITLSVPLFFFHFGFVGRSLDINNNSSNFMGL